MCSCLTLIPGASSLQASEQSAAPSQSYETLVPLGTDAEVLLPDFRQERVEVQKVMVVSLHVLLPGG